MFEFVEYIVSLSTETFWVKNLNPGLFMGQRARKTEKHSRPFGTNVTPCCVLLVSWLHCTGWS